MTLKIRFVDRPTFALASSGGSRTSAVAPKNYFSSDAVKVQIHSAASNQAAKAQSSNTNSVLNQFATQVSSLTNQIKDVEGKLGQAAEGTSQYTALSAEKVKLEAEYAKTTSVTGADGQPSALGNLITFLNQVGQSGAGASGLLNSGSSLIGASGVAAIQNAGSNAVQKLTTALSTLVNSGTSIDLDSTQAEVGEALSSIQDVLGTPTASDSSSGNSAFVVSSGNSAKPIQVSQLNLGQAQDLALTVRSASPNDLIRAAASGVDRSAVNALILSPHDPSHDHKKSNISEVTPPSDSDSKSAQ